MQFDKGVLDYHNYQKLIENEINYENELINIVEVDKTIENKFYILNRIKKRILILNDEINEIKIGKDEKEKTSEKDIKLDIGHDKIIHEHKKENEAGVCFKNSEKLQSLKKIDLENEIELLNNLYKLKDDYDEATNYFKNVKI